MADRRVVFVAYPGVHVLDVCGPGEAFAIANRSLTSTQPGYMVETAAPNPGEMVTSGGMRLVATAPVADLFPTITVDPLDAIFVRDGDVWTSAGITAGIDLALALVEEDHGRQLAAAVARQLVAFLQRPGGPSQFNVYVDVPPAGRRSVRDVQAWVADHLTEDPSVHALAARAGMSLRNFTRVCRAETRITPADYVEAARIEAVKHLLETTDAGVGELARTVGYGSVETLHRVFRQRVGITPTEYRRRTMACRAELAQHAWPPGDSARPPGASASGTRHLRRTTPPSIA